MKKLLALHGFTLDGQTMAFQMGPLAARLGERFDIEFPDAPHRCAPRSVARLYRRIPPPRGVQQHLQWWNASDDGATYEGWDETRARLTDLLSRSGPVGLLGFSQGAMVAATMAALSSRGEVPAIDFVILLAGALPRPRELRELFTPRCGVPSLHVVGREDQLLGEHPRELFEHFAPAGRDLVFWDGGHRVVRHGPPADAVVEFAFRHAT